MESLRRRQAYNRNNGGPPTKAVEKMAEKTNEAKSPASLMAVPIVETQIGMKRNIHHMTPADAYPDPGMRLKRRFSSIFPKSAFRILCARGSTRG